MALGSDTAEVGLCRVAAAALLVVAGVVYVFWFGGLGWFSFSFWRAVFQGEESEAPPNSWRMWVKMSLGCGNSERLYLVFRTRARKRWCCELVWVVRKGGSLSLLALVCLVLVVCNRNVLAGRYLNKTHTSVLQTE